MKHKKLWGLILANCFVLIHASAEGSWREYFLGKPKEPEKSQNSIPKIAEAGEVVKVESELKKAIDESLLYQTKDLNKFQIASDQIDVLINQLSRSENVKKSEEIRRDLLNLKSDFSQFSNNIDPTIATFLIENSSRQAFKLIEDVSKSNLNKGLKDKINSDIKTWLISLNYFLDDMNSLKKQDIVLNDVSSSSSSSSSSSISNILGESSLPGKKLNDAHDKELSIKKISDNNFKQLDNDLAQVIKDLIASGKRIEESVLQESLELEFVLNDLHKDKNADGVNYVIEHGDTIMLKLIDSVNSMDLDKPFKENILLKISNLKKDLENLNSSSRASSILLKSEHNNERDIEWVIPSLGNKSSRSPQALIYRRFSVDPMIGNSSLKAPGDSHLLGESSSAPNLRRIKAGDRFIDDRDGNIENMEAADR